MNADRPRLGLFLPEIGLASETFIRWDTNNILPGRTVVVADPPPGGRSVHGETTWTLDGQPALAFDAVASDPYPSKQRVSEALSFLEQHNVAVVLVEYLDFADRWFDHLCQAGHRVWLRGHGVDLSARLREPQWVDAYQRYVAADGIIVPSQYARLALTAIGLPKEKIFIVRYPVELPPRRSQPTGPGIRCVAVGRLVEKKAPLLVLEAFRRARRVNPHLTLDWVGNGPLLGRVREYVTDHQLRDVVRLHRAKPHDRTLALLRSADILLHHAVTGPDGDMEGQPLAVLEAMAAGLVVIATRHAGIPEIVTNGVTGCLVPERDVDSMASALIQLQADAVKRESMSRTARLAIAREHTASHAQQRLRQLMQLEEET
jgi:colanic acid/amylovoran biosynthesis glycosyltransferase